MEWLTRIIPGHAPDGAPILSILGKQTYKFKNGKAAQYDEDEQIAFQDADEYWGQGNPQNDAVKIESDIAAYKPMTDVVVIGNAHTPKGKKAYHLETGLQVGTAKKIVRVFGDRSVYVTGSSIAFSDPLPFERMPLDFSLAYGGIDEKSKEGTLFSYPPNPVGKGFVVKNTVQALQDMILPNLEDPQKLLTPQNLILGKFDRWREYPLPAAFGFTGKNFHPRYTMAGLPPDQHAANEMERQRALQKMPEVGTAPSNEPPPPLPILNAQFYNGASAGMAFPYLLGDEAIKLAHMDPDFPQFTFSLPGVRPKAWLNVGEGREEMGMVPHTVVLYKSTNQLTVVWRGSAYYAGIEAMKNFKAFEFGVKG